MIDIVIMEFNISPFFRSNQMKWTEEELRDCFYVFDSDGNGFIDMDELVTACKMLGCDDQQAEKLAQVNIKLSGDERVFHKHTTLAIMPILASEALLRENKQIQ